MFEEYRPSEKLVSLSKSFFGKVVARGLYRREESKFQSVLGHALSDNPDRTYEILDAAESVTIEYNEIAARLGRLG